MSPRELVRTLRRARAQRAELPRLRPFLHVLLRRRRRCAAPHAPVATRSDGATLVVHWPRAERGAAFERWHRDAIAADALTDVRIVDEP